VLAAAAPEMLEALKKLEVWLMAPATDYDTMQWAVGIVGDALSKAKDTP
jgi:hypothetical protein